MKTLSIVVYHAGTGTILNLSECSLVSVETEEFNNLDEYDQLIYLDKASGVTEPYETEEGGA